MTRDRMLMIAKLLEGYFVGHTVEAALHQDIHRVLVENGIECTHEVTLGQNRFDFLAFGNVVVEVKIKGSLADLIRQVHRYTLLEEVAGVLIVTTKMRLCRVPAELNGKPTLVALMRAL